MSSADGDNPELADVSGQGNSGAGSRLPFRHVDPADPGLILIHYK